MHPHPQDILPKLGTPYLWVLDKSGPPNHPISLSSVSYDLWSVHNLIMQWLCLMKMASLILIHVFSWYKIADWETAKSTFKVIIQLVSLESIFNVTVFLLINLVNISPINSCTTVKMNVTLLCHFHQSYIHMFANTCTWKQGKIVIIFCW